MKAGGVVSGIHHFFANQELMPRGQCYLGKAKLIYLHAISDTLISFSYLVIPLILFYFIRKKQLLPFSYIFFLFIFLITASGFTHLLEIWTLWYPDYWLSGGMKAFTGLVSLITVFALLKAIPQALKLTTPEYLKNVNEQLWVEIEKRKSAQEELDKRAKELERINQTMVEREIRMAELKAEIEKLKNK